MNAQRRIQIREKAIHYLLSVILDPKAKAHLRIQACVAVLPYVAQRMGTRSQRVSAKAAKQARALQVQKGSRWSS